VVQVLGDGGGVVTVDCGRRGNHGSVSNHSCGGSARVMVAAGIGGGCGGGGWRRWRRGWWPRLAAGVVAAGGGVRVLSGGTGDCGSHGDRGCGSNPCCGSSARVMVAAGTGSSPPEAGCGFSSWGGNCSRHGGCSCRGSFGSGVSSRCGCSAGVMVSRGDGIVADMVGVRDLALGQRKRPSRQARLPWQLH